MQPTPRVSTKTKDMQVGICETTVALVGCGKMKVKNAVQAKDLYIGVPFRLAMKHARATADDVHILSALHGLLSPFALIPPYDLSMAQLPPQKHFEWGKRVLASLRTEYPMQRLRIVFYAGKQYIRPITKMITDEDRYWTFENPLDGLDMYERIRWFKDHEPPF